jgi:hypothetical protein
MEVIRFLGFGDPLSYTGTWVKSKFGDGEAPENAFCRSETPLNPRY